MHAKLVLCAKVKNSIRKQRAKFMHAKLELCAKVKNSIRKQRAKLMHAKLENFAMMTDGSVTALKGVGEKTAKLLEKLGIVSITDLIEYYPRGYDIFALPVNISEVKEGETVAIECLISVKAETVKTKRFVIVSLRASDATGSIKLVWYNAPYIARQLQCGSRMIFRGRAVKKGKELIIAQPVIYTQEMYRRKLNELQPIYPLTKGITNNTISKLVREGLTLVDDSEDYLKMSDRKKYGLLRYSEALKQIHFPVSKDSCLAAHARIAFDEFVRFMALVRNMNESRVKEKNGFPVMDFSDCEELVRSLPYELTNAQYNVFKEIMNDLSGPGLMSRMVQGDVGSGKTIVALLASLACVKAGYQACIMAPTDVLARQHFDNFTQLLTGFGMRITLLTGQMPAAQKRQAYSLIENHETDIIIGTHALIQEKVTYACLGLAVIDEQHRFGVKQREAIRDKGSHPHILAMSATPIPRSLAIILYGDLDLSIIDEMPACRLPIKNCVVGTGYRPTAYNFIKKQVDEGHQAYVICPMVEESEESEGENVIDYAETLEEVFGPAVKVEYLHGKMKPAQKNEIMSRFGSGEINVLVSTTVVEVGVNVPNATVMMVENAERFGLAQLHQLRGRVGRGNAQSYCIFMKGAESKEIDERLDILVKYNDGMQVAEQDLKLRGPGDFFGTRQSGELEFKAADIYNDADILKKATDYVKELSEEELLCFSRTQTNNWII